MIKPKQIPPEAVEAAAKAVAAEVKHDWETAGDFRDKWRAVARAAIQAALPAWPKAYGNGPRKKWKYYTPAIILPLPPKKETSE